MANVIKLKNNNYLYGTLIEKTTNAYGTYEKYSDGRMIQYGVVEAPANIGYADITFPTAFVNTSYELLANHKYTGGSSYGGSSQLRNVVSPQPSTTTLGYIYSYLPDGSIANYPRKMYYRAYGNWK